MLSAKRAARLKPLLDVVTDRRPWVERVKFDPVEFPHRYRDPRDVEVVALISACLAYGRADLFKPRLEHLFASLGPHPARRLKALDVSELDALLEGFVYRFNLPADLGVLYLGIGECLRRFGTLEDVFLDARRRAEAPHEALPRFAATVRDAAPIPAVVARLGPVRGLHHLLPTGDGAAKRLSLFLRWMVRGPDGIDFGIWRRVEASTLTIPLDTHIARLSTWLGLTRRRVQGRAMAEEITASLRRLSPDDPVRYDFALCHFGMSGACPVRPRRENCRVCPLRSECQVGRRLVRR